MKIQKCVRTCIERDSLVSASEFDSPQLKPFSRFTALTAYFAGSVSDLADLQWWAQRTNHVPQGPPPPVLASIVKDLFRHVPEAGVASLAAGAEQLSPLMHAIASDIFGAKTATDDPVSKGAAAATSDAIQLPRAAPADSMISR